jgi:Transposase DDE domain
MHAMTVLQTCLAPALKQQHARRGRALLGAVTALVLGRRLVLMDLARSWPGAERIRAPLKCLDRLLSSRALHQERRLFYALISRWLARGERLIVLVDWSDLKRDGSWHLLRAAVPVGGRSVTIYEAVYSEAEKTKPRIEQAFLATLKTLLPPGCTPIIVTDAGFRTPWFRAVAALGWHWVGRVRHRTMVRDAQRGGLWQYHHALYAGTSATPRDLGSFEIVRYQPLSCRLIVQRKAPQGRKHRTVYGNVAASKHSRVNAAREREPWLLAASHSLCGLTARQIATIYAKRMQIELAFRDMKSHRFGCAFDDSLTRKGKRLEILLLLHALAAFAAWLVGLAATNQVQRLIPSGKAHARRRYSLLRLGWEVLRRQWMSPRDHVLRRLLNAPPGNLADAWLIA